MVFVNSQPKAVRFLIKKVNKTGAALALAVAQNQAKIITGLYPQVRLLAERGDFILHLWWLRLVG